MKTLIIGGGGREHALVKALKGSSLVTEVHGWPGSDGISREAFCHSIEEFAQISHKLSVARAELLSPEAHLIKWIQEEGIELVVVGPEALLVEGVADRIRAVGVDVFWSQ